MKNEYKPTKLTFYKPKYNKIMTILFNTIWEYECKYEGWGRKIFRRELGEQILWLIEHELKEEISKINKNEKEKNK